VVVVDVEPESAAERAGLQVGDVIVRVGDRAIRRITDFYGQTAVIFIGDEVTMEVLRDGRTRRLSLAITDDFLDKVSGERLDRRLSGTELQIFRNVDDDGLGAGVLVTDVEPTSAAWQFGLRPGDVIVAANRLPVRNLGDLRDGAQRSAQQLLLRVYRDGQFGYVAIR
jgi:S1-C subfamily serine protease